MRAVSPEAILFDLDGTLVDSERENVESVVLAVRRLGAELSAEERAFVIGHSWNEIHALIARNHGLDRLDGRAHRLGGRGEARRCWRRPATARCPARRRRCSGWALDRRWLWSRVRAAPRSQDALTSIGVIAAMRLWLGAEDYARGKPAPDSFALAIDRLGVKASACVAIEDATPGILSAEAAGRARHRRARRKLRGLRFVARRRRGRHARRRHRRALRAARRA